MKIHFFHGIVTSLRSWLLGKFRGNIIEDTIENQMVDNNAHTCRRLRSQLRSRPSPFCRLCGLCSANLRLSLTYPFRPTIRFFRSYLRRRVCWPQIQVALTWFFCDLKILSAKSLILDKARPLIQHSVEQLLDALSQYVRRVKMPNVLGVLPPSPNVAKALVRDIETANDYLMAQARSLPGIALLSQEEIDLVSTDTRYDSLSDGLAHIPYTEEHYASLALAITRKVHALRVPTHKVLVLDCDNTLWRGSWAKMASMAFQFPRLWLVFSASP